MANGQKFQLGRKKPDPVHLEKSLRFANFVKPVLPPYPLVDNNFDDYGLTNWPVLGNDRWGDCVAVAIAHLTRLYRKALVGVDEEWTLQQVLDFYSTQNPNGSDQGMDMQTALEELLHNGGPDGVKIAAFARVDQKNYAEVRAAIHVFGSLLPGYIVQYHNMDEFDAGKPWTFDPNDGEAGGHATALAGYGQFMADAFDTVGWGKQYHLTEPFWQHECEELWVMIRPELLGSKRFADYVELDALAAQFSEITHGGVLPIPVTPPAPNPNPTPIPAPNTNQWWIDFLTKLLSVKGIPKWVKLILAELIKALGG